jgi:hypothetical protein
LRRSQVFTKNAFKVDLATFTTYLVSLIHVARGLVIVAFRVLLARLDAQALFMWQDKVLRLALRR